MMNKHVYTQEQLDQMSDVEKTIACAEKMGYEVILIDKDSINVKIPDFGGIHYYNPLENYNDCMPIVERHYLWINPDSINKMFVVTNDVYHHAVVKAMQPTIQRAIVYCFLLMEV